MDSFYNFSKEVDSYDYTYTFITKENICYSVELQGSTYQEYAEIFPILMEYGYGLVITRIPMVQVDKFKFDDKIRKTIAEIIKKHFVDYGDSTIILYECYDGDGKQRHRSITFGSWFRCLNDKNEFVKESLPIDKNGDKTYIGYIGSNNNENLSKIKTEFEDFSKSMTLVK